MLTDFSFNSGETEIGKETINLHSMSINRTIYDGINIYLHNFTCNDTDVVIKDLRVRVAIANVVNCQEGFKNSKNLENLNGFIGLGIFNQLTEDLLLDKKYSKKGLGSHILRNILLSILNLSKTKVGLRFVTVDAYATALNFYVKKNNFSSRKSDTETLKKIDKIKKQNPNRSFILYLDLKDINCSKD
jgi:hypothetical protein